MTFTDSIVAIATPMGVGGICIVRLSGTKSLDIASKITHKDSLTPRYATLCSLYDDKDLLFDEAIVIYYKAPKSYTCEDVIEFQCHGGDLIGRKIIELCLIYGARLANAGEFTKRAFLNGRIDFAQVNAISQITKATDSHFQQALASQLKGELGSFVERVREVLLSALAHCEVMIDYSEEDIPANIITTIESKLSDLTEELSQIFEFSLMRQGVSAGLNLCIIGRPNVGKSSILNAILLNDRAITSPLAGTTRDTIEENVSIDGNIVRLIDTAGIRESGDLIEKEGIKKSKLALQQSNIILLVLDSSESLNQEDSEILELIKNTLDSKNSESKHLIIALNKSDKPPKITPKDIAKMQLNAKIIQINALDKKNSALALKNVLKEIILDSRIDSSVILSATYQIQAVQKTIDSLKNAKVKLDSLELELFAYHIKDALEAIGQITHPYGASEMLDVMFGEFCLGK